MILPTPADAATPVTTPILPCAGPSGACPAINGRAVTCPAPVQRRCGTLATLRRIAAPAGTRSHFCGAGAVGATA
jgi:hypothetical protein